MTLTGGHARSSSEVSQQSLENMFLKYIPPPGGYDSEVWGLGARSLSGQKNGRTFHMP